MQQVIIQPASHKIARSNYSETVENGVKLEVIKQYVDSDTFDKIASYYKNTKTKVWGLAPRTTIKNSNSWNRVNSGDVILFLRDKVAYASATVVLKIHNSNLARAIWGLDDKNETWEYIFFLDELKHQNIASSTLVDLIDQGQGQNFMYTQVIGARTSDPVIDKYHLASQTYQPTVDEADYADAIKRLGNESDLEKRTSAFTRLEQAFLRTSLFEGRKYSQCGICNKTYPVEFLVTAHIKKRSFCTVAEKLDFKNIVMPMCKFGCDDLYERGYIGVDKGSVYVKTTDSDSSDPIRDYLDIINGAKCEYWNEETKGYFQWHNNQLRV